MSPAARIPLVLLAAALLAAALAGCGGDGGGEGASATEPGSAPAGAAALECKAHASDAEQLRAAGVACPWARALMYRWGGRRDCAPAGGASRSSCRIGAFRCRGTAAGRGVAVSCARPGRSVAFLSTRGA